MAIDPRSLTEMIEDELAGVSDADVASYIRGLLVDPTPVDRLWDYGAADQRYTCWTVLEHRTVGVAYCEEGFGPKCPWGLVWLDGDDARQSMGMDSSWYSRFLDAVGEEALSGAPIWRVFMTPPSGSSQALTKRGGWEDTWRQVMALRGADQNNSYDCWTDALPWGAHLTREPV